jgi:hypothetical protein
MFISGVFLIQRLEGSRFGMVALWVLNGGKKLGGRGGSELTAGERGNVCVNEDCSQPVSRVGDEKGRRIALVVECAAES